MGFLYEQLRRSGERIADLIPTSVDGKASEGKVSRPQRAAGHPGLAETPIGSDACSGLQHVIVEKVDLRPEIRLVLQSDPGGPGADRFRFLGMRLRNSLAYGKLRTLLVTSPLPGDGKSTTALNLATALAERGKRNVLLVEADFYNPTLGLALRIEGGPGLAECLEDKLDPLSALRRLDPLQWYLLPAGKSRRNPTELLQSDALVSLMRRLGGLFDWILIDTPPVIPLADAVALSRCADGSLLVVRADRTSSEAVEDAIALLGPNHVLGILLNGAEGLNRLYSKYYGYYGAKKRHGL
jgi:capsular exopolysaccharide synthesis family protein